MHRHYYITLRRHSPALHRTMAPAPSIAVSNPLDNSFASSHHNDPKAKKLLARKRFDDVFAIIRSELLTHFHNQGMPPEATEWYRRVRLLSCHIPLLLLSPQFLRISTTMSLAENSTVVSASSTLQRSSLAALCLTMSTSRLPSSAGVLNLLVSFLFPPPCRPYV